MSGLIFGILSWKLPEDGNIGTRLTAETRFVDYPVDHWLDRGGLGYRAPERVYVHRTKSSYCTLLSCHEILHSVVSTSLCAEINCFAGASKY